MRMVAAFGALALLAAAGGAGLSAWVEASGRAAAEAALAADGHDWARVEADGARLTVAGMAPDGATAAAARLAASRAAPLSAVDSTVRVAEAAAPAPPPAASLPPPDLARADRDVAALPRLAPAAPAPPAADLPLSVRREGDGFLIAGAASPEEVAALEAAAAALPGAPPLRDATMPAAAPADPARASLAAAALRAMAPLETARAELRRGVLSLDAAAADAETRARLEDALRRAAPPGTVLLLDVASPPPVLSPFRFVVAKSAAGPVILGCDARDEGERRALAEAVGALGGPPEASRPSLCRVGIGAPSEDWGRAAEAGIAALAAVPAARFELIDARARFVALPPTTRTEATAAARGLGAALPPGWSLDLVLPARGTGGGPEGDGPAAAWFEASRAGGVVELAGRSPDAASRQALLAYARARLGPGEVRAALPPADAPPPPAWRRAALVAMDALAALPEGSARFDGAGVTVDGRATRPAAARAATAALAPLAELGLAATTRVVIDTAAAAERLPLPADACLAALARTVRSDPVVFAPGAATLGADQSAGLDRLAALALRCPEAAVEIGGHTDAQGSAESNRGLSRRRAEAVLDALVARGVDPARLEARGYGEAEPLADNATAAGRARNRRIEFRAPDAADAAPASGSGAG